MDVRLPQQSGAAPRVSAVLREARSEVLRQWEQAARLLPGSERLSHEALVDSFPEYLDRLADTLAVGTPADRAALDEVIALHALHRLEADQPLERIVGEYIALRELVPRVSEERTGERPPPEEQLLLNAAVDHSVVASAALYGRQRDRTLAAIDRLTRAALDEGHETELVQRLLQALKESTPSVDTATLLLLEGDRLRVAATVGLEEELDTGFSLRPGEGFAGQVAAERRPMLLRDASHDPIVRSPIVRARGIRALYGVPLLDEGALVGVAHIGSLTREEFPQDEQLLFRTLAQRAASMLARLRLTAEVREANERTRQVLESISDAFITLDPDWRLTYVNREAERLLGKPREELLGRDHWEVFPESLGTPIEVNYRRAVREGRPISFENYYAPWRRWFELRAAPTQSGGLAVYFHDVTERHQGDAERERLRLEAERAREVLEHGDALLLLDRDFRVLQTNEMHERLSHTPREQLLGRVLWDVWPEAADPTSKFWAEYHRVMEERVPVSFEEYFAPLDMWTGITAYPTRDGGVAAFLRDVSERKRTERLRELLLGVVGHDLRTPLTAVLLGARTLARREDLSPRAQAGVERIVRSAERMSRLIEQLLDATRAQVGGGIPLAPEPCDLCDIAHASCEDFEQTAPGRVRLRCAAEHSIGMWDPDRLGQVVGNLVSNALAHGAPGTPVEVDVRHEREEFLVSVHNEGEPIPPALMPHLFDPFRRAHGASAGGLGLGLYIVREIVRAHGGRIDVDSRPGAGTTFTVRLPRRPPAHDAPAAAAR